MGWTLNPLVEGSIPSRPTSLMRLRAIAVANVTPLGLRRSYIRGLATLSRTSIGVSYIRHTLALAKAKEP